MNAFVIARKNLEFLDTPVFRAGQAGDEEAIAVFTTRELAAKYVDDAGWSGEYEAGELQPIQLVRWLAVAKEEGTELLVVNPDRHEHLAGTRQRVVNLDEPFAAFASLLRNEIIKQAGQQAAEADSKESNASRELVDRFNKLGISCEEVALDHLDSASATLCCFPMYMIANAATLTDDPELESKRRDLLGIAKLRELFVVGQKEAELQQTFDFDSRHRDVLHSLLEPRPVDKIVYAEALEVLSRLFTRADPRVVAKAKRAIARMIVAVASAAGEGWFGAGHEATAGQREYIQEVRETLALDDDPGAKAVLDEVMAS